MAGISWTKQEQELLVGLYNSDRPITSFPDALTRRTLPSIIGKMQALGLHGKVSYWEKPVTLDLSDAEKGYFAGFIDGEGSLCFSMNSESGLVPKISIANSNKDVLLWARQKIGGSIGRMAPRAWRHQAETYQLIIASKRKVFPLLEAILPYLKIKRDRAELMIEWCKSRLARPNYNRSPFTKREIDIVREVTMLNRRTRRGRNREKRHERLLNYLERLENV
jgi:hypothetical protein